MENQEINLVGKDSYEDMEDDANLSKKDNESSFSRDSDSHNSKPLSINLRKSVSPRNSINDFFNIYSEGSHHQIQNSNNKVKPLTERVTPKKPSTKEVSRDNSVSDNMEQKNTLRSNGEKKNVFKDDDTYLLSSLEKQKKEYDQLSEKEINLEMIDPIKTKLKLNFTVAENEEKEKQEGKEKKATSKGENGIFGDKKVTINIVKNEDDDGRENMDDWNSKVSDERYGTGFKECKTEEDLNTNAALMEEHREIVKNVVSDLVSNDKNPRKSWVGLTKAETNSDLYRYIVRKETIVSNLRLSLSILPFSVSIIRKS